jgi:hypothetical protein
MISYTQLNFTTQLRRQCDYRRMRVSSDTSTSSLQVQRLVLLDSIENRLLKPPTQQHTLPFSDDAMMSEAALIQLVTNGSTKFASKQ